jgi:hypothetical protein
MTSARRLASNAAPIYSCTSSAITHGRWYRSFSGWWGAILLPWFLDTIVYWLEMPIRGGLLLILLSRFWKRLNVRAGQGIGNGALCLQPAMRWSRPEKTRSMPGNLFQPIARRAQSQVTLPRRALGGA